MTSMTKTNLGNILSKQPRRDQVEQDKGKGAQHQGISGALQRIRKAWGIPLPTTAQSTSR